MLLSPTPRRWLLSIHMLFSGVLLGVTVAMLVLTIAAWASGERHALIAGFVGVDILAGTILRISTVGAIGTGLLMSWWTKWGFFKYKWVIAKQILSLGVVLIGLVGLHMLSSDAGRRALAPAESSDLPPTVGFVATALVLALATQIAILATLWLISIFKPWGGREAKNEMKKADSAPGAARA